MSICGEPGIYNHCDSFVAAEMPIWRWAELADTNRYCLLRPGHAGLHRDGTHAWGKLVALGLEEPDGD